MTDVIWAAIIGLIGTLLATIIGLVQNISLKKKVNYYSHNNAYIRFLQADESFRGLLPKVKCISMYTVNSYELLSHVNKVLEQDSRIIIKKLVILVRKKIDENHADLEILNNNIEMWKNWVKRKRIKNLTIISYDHDPDHYYTIIGDRTVFSGQILFDKTKPTGTTVDYIPLVFGDDTDIGRQVIKNYQRHFDNAVLNYKDQSTIYDSTKDV